MRNLRIAHVADTHLGYRTGSIKGRDEDFAHSWITACRAIVDSKPDLILHAGDVFHHPQPSWSAVVDFLEGANILQAYGAPILLISGNHDSARMLQKRTIFNLLSEILTFPICHDDKPQVHRLRELETSVVLVSHRALINRDLDSNLDDALASLDSVGYKILVSHGSVGDLETYREMGSVVIPDSLFKYPWNYVALGHLHMAQPFGKVGWYSGSIERCGWSDFPASPAWTLVTLTPNGVSHEQRSLPHLRMVEIADLECETFSDLDIAKELQRSVEKFQSGEDRLLVRCKLKGISNYRQRSVSVATRRALALSHPGVTIQLRVEGAVRILEGDWTRETTDVTKSIEEMFVDFVASRTTHTPEFHEAFLAKGLELISAVRQEEAEANAAE